MTRAYYMTPREKVLHTAQFSFDLLSTGFCLSTTLSKFIFGKSRDNTMIGKMAVWSNAKEKSGNWVVR